MLGTPFGLAKQTIAPRPETRRGPDARLAWGIWIASAAAAAAAAEGCFRTFENFQYYPPTARAKGLLDSGAAGEPLSIRMKVVTGTKPGWEIPYERWAWRFDPARGGNGRIMLDYGSRTCALALHLMGDVEKVLSWITYRTIQHGWTIDSPALAMWKYRDAQKYGSFEVVSSDGMLIRSKYVPEDDWIEITGSKGSSGSTAAARPAAG